MSDVSPVTETVVFNLRNQRPDSIVIDPLALAGTVPRRIIIESDASDRWIMMQNECWQPIQDNLDIGPYLVFDAGQPTKVRLIDAENHQVDQQISVFAQGVVDVPGYRHLSANSEYTVDVIDLRNGGKDVLILRSDRHLRQRLPVFIKGDEGLNEIRIEGSAGWQTQYSDFGIVAVIPFGPSNDITVVLAPGLELAILPTSVLR